jgi:hypothetical protein
MLHTRQTSGDDGHTYLGIRNPCIQILEYVLKNSVYLLEDKYNKFFYVLIKGLLPRR